MNFVFISPHFPTNFYHFCQRLNRIGVKVLGLSDEPYAHLRQELKNVLTEYYQVHDMHNQEELIRALGYFTHRHGKIDRIDSLNEYWLETEALLRTDFNIFGIKADEIKKFKSKSLMKEYYIKAGVPVARGKIVSKLKEAQEWIHETGYPVVAKPDIGVGAAKTYKIHNKKELLSFFNTKPDVPYIMEEFIQGKIFTFDGLTDRNGKAVFYTSHTYSQGIMEIVNNGADVYYYSLRKIPEDLEDAGKKVLKAFCVKERFFHFEFFRSSKTKKIVALEVNIRPPGGFTTDMFNYANDLDIYSEWANIMVYDRFTAKYNRPYHCCYISRKFNRMYLHSHHDILNKFEKQLCHHEAISGIFSAALGDYGYIVRSKNLSEIISIAEYIHQKSQA